MDLRDTEAHGGQAAGKAGRRRKRVGQRQRQRIGGAAVPRLRNYEREDVAQIGSMAFWIVPP